MRSKLIFSSVILVLLQLTLYAQDDLDIIQSLLQKDQIDQADSAITSQINKYKQEGDYQAIIFHGYFLGKIELNRGNPKRAIERTNEFIADFVAHANPHNAYEAVLDLAWIHDEIGDIQRAYEMNLQARDLCRQSPNCTKENLGLLEYNLGARILDLGDVAQATTHLRQALKYYLQHPNITDQRLYQAYNAMGAVSYQNSHLDSALYYYGLSLEKVASSDYSFYEKSRQKMYIYSNLADTHAELGNIQKSNDLLLEIIGNYQILIDSTDDISLAFEARRILMSSWANIGANYQELGDIEKSYEISKYTYEARKKYLQPNDPDIIKSLNHVGTAASALHRLEEAKQYFEQAISTIDSIPGDYLRQDATAHFELGKLNYQIGNAQRGEELFETAGKLFQKSLQDQYNADYLNFLRSTALIYAQNDRAEKAMANGLKAHNFTGSLEQGISVNHYKQSINLAEVYFELKEYEKCLESLAQASQIGALLIRRTGNLLDSLQVGNFIPTVLYLKSHARYLSNESRETPFLVDLLQDVDQAIKSLENQKSLITSTKSIGLLHSSNKDLFDFAKKLSLQLYEQTKDTRYLDRVISMHESNIYSRIRTRLNQRKTMSFLGVPDEVIQEEVAIKQSLAGNLAVDQDDEPARIKDLLQSNNRWTTFLGKLKREYPKYYHTRYASILEPLKDLNIPEEITLIRYFYVGGDLKALVLTAQERHFYQLDGTDIGSKIIELNHGIKNMETLSKALHELYQQLWAPLVAEVNTSRVVILPDRELFNLSFEILTPEKIHNYREFGTNSLLAKHAISYNYSLVLLNDEKKEYHQDLIAFAPGFSRAMKEQYQLTIGDTLKWDRTYLTLLSQPFSMDLANSVHELFSGELFMEDRSTEENFKQQARDHKIIHIGTHAESNNHNPELSRLIFAKDLDQGYLEDDNSLYAYEIYNCQLGSNLTVLTACETGKPSYQAGEGMISLAHAFNYAGSESLLTSLWKIDEASSARIVALFYQQLLKGQSKDQALRQAKLDYIASAQGRTISPQYWAGLILMGDVSAIDLSERLPFWYYLLGLLVIALILGILRKWVRLDPPV